MLSAVAAEKFGGAWYSLLELGKCDDTDKPCNWRFVRTEKRVSRECLHNSWHAAVEEHFEPHCMNKCKDSGIGLARNVSSRCWVQCWTAAALGQHAGRWPVRSQMGMSEIDLRNAWLAPFASDDPKQGGCPHLPRDDESSLLV